MYKQTILCLMNDVTTFYNKKIYEKYNNLKNTKSHKRKDLGIKTNFPQLYESICFSRLTFLHTDYELHCDCATCLSDIEMNFDFDKKSNDLKEFRKHMMMKNVKKCKIKIKYYFCEKRIDTILNHIYKFALHNNTNIAILVPNEYQTVHKIINILVKYSNNLIKKISANTLSYSTINIHLVSPLHFTEGFCVNSSSIGLVLLNAFYYHMFLTHINYEELTSAIWKFKISNACLTIISDSNEIFDREHNILFEICDDLKIITSYQ